MDGAGTWLVADAKYAYQKIEFINSHTSTHANEQDSSINTGNSLKNGANDATKCRTRLDGKTP